jgi:hypothetical protein
MSGLNRGSIDDDTILRLLFASLAARGSSRFNIAKFSLLSCLARICVGFIVPEKEKKDAAGCREAQGISVKFLLPAKFDSFFFSLPLNKREKTTGTVVVAIQSPFEFL